MNFLKTLDLFCVECGGKISQDNCGTCGKKYARTRDIPVLLSNEDESSELFQRYLKNYETIAQDDLEKDILPLEYRQVQASKLLRYCGPGILGAVLDMGSGRGDFLKKVPHSRKLALDVSLRLLKELQASDIGGILCNAENMPFQNAFDVVVMTDILEHVFHPEKAVAGAHRALKKNGRVVARVPYKEDLRPYSKEEGCKYEFVHLRSFDEQSLGECFTRAGFKICRFERDGFDFGHLKKNDANPFTKFCARAINKMVKMSVLGGLSMKSWESFFYRVPNWLGNRLIDPVELVLIAEKA